MFSLYTSKNTRETNVHYNVTNTDPGKLESCRQTATEQKKVTVSKKIQANFLINN